MAVDRYFDPRSGANIPLATALASPASYTFFDARTGIILPLAQAIANPAGLVYFDPKSGQNYPAAPILAAGGGGGTVMAPELVIDPYGTSVRMASEPQDGVTYALFSIDRVGTVVLLGALNAGNGYARDVAGTRTKMLYAVATKSGEPPETSAKVALSPAGLIEATDFSEQPDNSDLSQIVINGVPNVYQLVGAGTSGTYRVLDGVLKQFVKSPVAFYRRSGVKFMGRSERFRKSNIDGWTSYRRWNIGNVTGTQYVLVTVSQADWNISVVNNSAGYPGGGQETLPTTFWKNDVGAGAQLTDGVTIAALPVWGEDGSLYYQLYRNGAPQIDSNGGKGLRVANPAALGTSADIVTVTLNDNANPIYLPWDVIDRVELRSYENATFTNKTIAISRPTRSIPPRLTFDAFIRGTHASITYFLFEAETGRVLTDFKTSSTAGGGLTGSLFMDFDAIEVGGKDASVGCFDPADPVATFSILPVGTIPFYQTISDEIFIGSNFAPYFSVDHWNDRMENVKDWTYQTNAGAFVDTPLDRGVDGVPTGVYTALAVAGGARRMSMFPINGQIIAANSGTNWQCVIPVPPSKYDAIPFGAQNGVTIGAVDISNPNFIRVPFTATPGMAGKFQLVIRPKDSIWNGGNIAPADLPPNNFYCPTAPVGADLTKKWVPDIPVDFGVASGRSLWRPMQMAGNAASPQAEIYQPTPPYVNLPYVVDSGRKVNRLSAELGCIPWFNMASLETNERMIQWGLYWARDIISYLADPAVPIGQKWFGEHWFAIGNEQSNQGPGSVFLIEAQRAIPLAAEAGFVPGCLSRPIFDLQTATAANRLYLKDAATTLQKDLGPYESVFGAAKDPATGVSRFCIIQNTSNAIVPAGQPLPGNLNVSGSANGPLTCIANYNLCHTSIHFWRAWMTGVLGELFKRGVAPGARGVMPDLGHYSDPTAALGPDKVRVIFETFQPDAPTDVAQWTLSAQPGSLDGIGPSFYLNHFSQLVDPANTVAWDAWNTSLGGAPQLIENDHDYTAAIAPYIAYLQARYVAETRNNINNQLFTVYDALRKAGWTDEQCPRPMLYEGGVHIATNAQSQDQANRWAAFYTVLYASTPWRAFTKSSLLDVYENCFPVAMSTFTSYEFPGLPVYSDAGTPGWRYQRFNELSYPGFRGEAARWLGENDFIAEVNA